MQTRLVQAGFTLIEIAIVLVIVGLILGGILKGQEMITQARIKNVVNDFNGITAAYFAYQDRYRAVPGDDVEAATRWTAAVFPPSGGLNGTGDGVVSGRYMTTVADLVASPPTAATGESNNFWWHLRLAGLVSGASSGPAAWTPPVNAVGGLIGVQNGAPGFNAGASRLAGLVLCSANMPDKIASAVDSQVDDQRSSTGQMFGYPQGAASNPDIEAGPIFAAANYIESDSNQYVICKKI